MKKVGGMDMALEYELKYKSTDGMLKEIDAAVDGDARVIAMETTYYDTPTGQFSARMYTLRRRLESGVSVCTLKVPAGNARGEWETECDSIEDAIPKLLAMGCPEEASVLAQEGLVPTCGAKFTRIAKTVTLAGGAVELALDRGFLLGGGREEPLCEVEVELKEGSAEACDRFARELAARFGLVPEEKSKYRRALALCKGE